MTAKARVGFVRRLQLWAIARLRRSRFLPAGIPDKVADEERLGQPFSQPIMLFFATVQDSLYQLRPWYHALQALSAEHPVIAVFKDSRTARTVRAESGLDCVTVGTYGELDRVLGRSNVKLALYVNQDPLNFEALRFTSMAHVYVGHGDSDKAVFTSHQIQAYDFYFVAGQAAIDRVGREVMFFDAADRCIPIGQTTRGNGPPPPDGSDSTETHSTGRPVILYAPTWEGAQPSVAYGSLVTHGPTLIESLLRDGEFEIIYRPHPLSGVNNRQYATADQAIRDRLAATGHRIDIADSFDQSVADADLLITDVSAMTSHWLPSQKPVLVTTPSDDAAAVHPNSLSTSLPQLTHADADNAAQVVRELLRGEPLPSSLIEYHLGDASAGPANDRFVSACGAIIARRDAAWSRLRANGAKGP